MQIKVQSGDGTPPRSRDLLVRVAFDPTPSQEAVHEQVVQTGLRPLGGVVTEDWLSATPVVSGRRGAFRYAYNQEVCFGWLCVSAADPVEMATYATYMTAFRVFAELGFPHWLRAWHYLPDIHALEAGVSRYQSFCRGRVAAFQEVGNQSYCAATVIGTQAAFGAMYFLAARAPGIAVENPRQTSAWQYPCSQAQERPLFARAVCKAWEEGTHFYVSGTAGIVGHESQHPGDVAAQLREALANLRALLDETLDFRGVERLSGLKVYIAHADDTAVVREVLATSPFKADSLALLEGKICRPELRVEIEALIV